LATVVRIRNDLISELGQKVIPLHERIFGRTEEIWSAATRNLTTGSTDPLSNDINRGLRRNGTGVYVSSQFLRYYLCAASVGSLDTTTGSSNMNTRHWKLLLIHGVGFFDPEEVVDNVSAQLENYGIPKSLVLPFDWDSVTTTLFPRKSIFAPTDPNFQFLAELNAALIQSAHLGFLSDSDCYAGMSRPVLRLHNFIAFLLQLACVLLIPVMTWDFFFFAAPFLWLARIVLLVFAIAALLQLVGTISLRRSAWLASLRRMIILLCHPLSSFLALLVSNSILIFIASWILIATINALVKDPLGLRSILDTRKMTRETRRRSNIAQCPIMVLRC